MSRSLKRTYEKIKETIHSPLSASTPGFVTLCCTIGLCASLLTNPAECSGVLQGMIAAAPVAFLTAIVSNVVTYFQTNKQDPLTFAKNLSTIAASTIGYGVAVLASKLFMPQHEHDEMGMPATKEFQELGYDLLCLGLVVAGTIAPSLLIQHFWPKKKLPETALAEAHSFFFQEHIAIATQLNPGQTPPVPAGGWAWAQMVSHHPPQNLNQGNII